MATAEGAVPKPRQRLSSLKNHVPEHHGNHPDNQAMFRDLRNISDKVNKTTRFHFKELETDVDLSQGARPGQFRSRSDPIVGQYK